MLGEADAALSACSTIRTGRKASGGNVAKDRGLAAADVPQADINTAIVRAASIAFHVKTLDSC